MATIRKLFFKRWTMTHLNNTPLIEHLKLQYGAHMSAQALMKSELFLLPDNPSVYPTAYRPFGLRGGLLDDTRTISLRGLGYAVGKYTPIEENPLSDYTPISYVFNAAGIDSRHYQLRPMNDHDAYTPIGPRGKILGVIELPTTLARGWQKNGRPEDYRDFMVCEADMFLVADKLVPAKAWVALPKCARTQHMAADHGLV